MARDIFLNELNIENYKGFETLQLNTLGRVNIFTGKNDVGKTSLLEAIYLLLGPTNPDLWLTSLDVVVL